MGEFLSSVLGGVFGLVGLFILQCLLVAWGTASFWVTFKILGIDVEGFTA